MAPAAVGAAQFLLTQNRRHIANAHTLPRVYRTLEQRGYPGLLIYTPAEFLGARTMTHNPILEELYAIREKLLAEAGGDLQVFGRCSRPRSRFRPLVRAEGREGLGTGSEPDKWLQRTCQPSTFVGCLGSPDRKSRPDEVLNPAGLLLRR